MHIHICEGRLCGFTHSSGSPITMMGPDLILIMHIQRAHNLTPSKAPAEATGADVAGESWASHSPPPPMNYKGSTH